MKSSPAAGPRVTLADRPTRRTTSDASLDVAASVFTSLRELEASGRNLSSQGALSGASGPPLGIPGGGRGAVGGMSALENMRLGGLRSSMGGLGPVRRRPSLNFEGGGFAHNAKNVVLAAQAAQRDRIAALAAARAGAEGVLPSLGAAGGAGLHTKAALQVQAELQAIEFRRLEMEGLLLHRQRKNLQQQLLGDSGGRIPPRSPDPLAGFTSSQLLMEVSRRMPSESTRTGSREVNDAVFATAIPQPAPASSSKVPQSSSIDTSKKSGGANATISASAGSPDALLSAAILVAQEDKAKKLESLINASPPSVVPSSNNNDENSKGSIGGGGVVDGKSHESINLSKNPNASKTSTSTHPTATRIGNNEGVLSPLNTHELLQMKALLSQDRHQGTANTAPHPFLDGIGMATTGNLGAPFSARQMPSAAAMMASLEAMRRKEMAERDRMLLELQAQIALRGQLSSGIGDLTTGGRHAAWIGRDLAPFEDGPWSGAPLSAVPSSAESLALAAMFSRLRGTPPGAEGAPMLGQGEGLPAPTVNASPTAPPPAPRVDPKRVLREFLDRFGEEARASRRRLRKAIADTEESQAAIHKWDRAQGLRKCHSRTVVRNVFVN